MMDLQFNAAEILEKRLSSSLGLDRYAEIMQKAKTTNISKDREGTSGGIVWHPSQTKNHEQETQKADTCSKVHFTGRCLGRD